MNIIYGDVFQKYCQHNLMTIEHLHTCSKFFLLSNFYQARVHQDIRAYLLILKLNVNSVTEKRFSLPQMKRLASGHSFHVSLKALIIICSSQPKWDCRLGSLDFQRYRVAATRAQGSALFSPHSSLS